MGERMGHDFVLAPKPGQRRNAGDRDGADHEQLMRPGNLRGQAAHFANVLLAGQGVNDGPGRQEQQGFKKRMGHEVKNRGRVGSDTRSQEHVAQLADGRIGQDTLNVGLDQADRGGE